MSIFISWQIHAPLKMQTGKAFFFIYFSFSFSSLYRMKHKLLQIIILGLCKDTIFLRWARKNLLEKICSWIKCFVISGAHFYPHTWNWFETIVSTNLIDFLLLVSSPFNFLYKWKPNFSDFFGRKWTKKSFKRKKQRWQQSIVAVFWTNKISGVCANLKENTLFLLSYLNHYR